MNVTVCLSARSFVSCRMSKPRSDEFAKVFFKTPLHVEPVGLCSIADAWVLWRSLPLSSADRNVRFRVFSSVLRTGTSLGWVRGNYNCWFALKSNHLTKLDGNG
jgi:hypothetical protein